ncbi:GDP-perosamine synthase [subsurface metagenome]
MICRLRPYFGYKELLAAIRPKPDAVEMFEREFARLFETRYALTFSYGRSGLYALFKVLELQNAEVIVPAYTCVVVPHAVVFSGNIPVFVDCVPDGFNMDLNALEKAVTPKTRAIIPTHLFGYPMDVERVNKIAQAQKQKVYVIQDCAHSFGAKWKGQLVNKAGDAAIFGSNISKVLSTIFGGIVTTDDEQIYKKLKSYRTHHFRRPSWTKSIKRLLYLLSTYITFQPVVYGFVNNLEKMGLLNRFVKYYDEAKIDFPDDFQDLMLPIEARVGLEQLKKYPEIIGQRKAISEYYSQYLQGITDLELPPLVEGATYSHFVCLVDKRQKWLERARERGVQLGQLIEYSIPYMKAYTPYKNGEYPVSKYYSEHTINLPNWPGLRKKDLEYLSDCVR